MTSLATGGSRTVPVYLLAGAPVLQQPRAGQDSGDPSLATEILPGPPQVASVKQTAARRDSKKYAPLVSFLPQHDPGTSYAGMAAAPVTGTGILEANLEVDGPRRKRARVDKGLAGQRPQRASARSLNAVGHGADTAVASGDGVAALELPDGDHVLAQDSDGPVLSRSNSSPNLVEEISMPPSSSARPQRKDKGKGKEKAAVRIKEEPMTVTLQQLSEPSFSHRNEDHCSACRSLGSLVYCDGCPRAYHLICLDPPMDVSDVPEGENRWYCPSCKLRQHPPPKPPLNSFMAPLVQHVLNSTPTEFQLPDDIRTFFKGVAASTRGGYVDTTLIKPPRLNRHGQLEDRDPYRTKDRNGAPVLCFRCGFSALPDGMAVTAPVSKRPRRASTQPSVSEQWKSIVSCDYCSLHWHLDCVDPPLLTMPPLDTKWMCPNHAEHAFRHKPRIPKQNAAPIDIAKPGQLNNGNIEISEPIEPTSTHDKVPVDEVFINGRRYRIPERTVVLDFWHKINKDRNPMAYRSGLDSITSSPLTSLSALEDETPAPSQTPHPRPSVSTLDTEDLRLALLLVDMSATKITSESQPGPAQPSTSTTQPTQNGLNHATNTSPQTSTQRPTIINRRTNSNSSRITVNLTKPQARKATEPSNPEPASAPPIAGSSIVVKSEPCTVVIPPMRNQRAKRQTKRQSVAQAQAEGQESASAPAAPERKQPARASKRDVKYVIALDLNDSADETAPVASTSQQPVPMDVDTPPPASAVKKPTRTRTKKEEKEPLIPTSPLTPKKAAASGSKGRAARAAAAASTSASAPVPAPTNTSASISSPSKPTPSISAVPSSSSTSLKIRLPRLADINFGAHATHANSNSNFKSTSGAGSSSTGAAASKVNGAGVAARPRRSLRRQDSTPASTSTSLSRVDGDMQ